VTHATQATTSLAIELGLVPPQDITAVTDVLVDDVMVKHNGHLDVGIVGVKYLLSSLSQVTLLTLHCTLCTVHAYCMCTSTEY
jgi:hypothetical protein